MDMQLQQNSNYRKYNSNSVPLNRRNQNIYIIDKYIELWLIGKSDEYLKTISFIYMLKQTTDLNKD